MTQSAPPPPCDLDSLYYWDFITFSVENRLFRIPKYRLVSESEHFASKYAHVNGDSSSEHDSEYATVENPQLNAVKLNDVSADEFQHFLKAVYPMDIQGGLMLSKDEWVSVLKLSTKWFFNELRKLAIGKLASLDLDPFEQIRLGKEYSIEEQLLTGYRELVIRHEPLTVAEAQVIGLENAIRLNPIRESWIRKGPGVTEVGIDEMIQATFLDDFKLVRDIQCLYQTSEEKQEHIRMAECEAEKERLRAREAEEEKRLSDLMLELEMQRKKVEELKPAAECGRKILSSRESSVSRSPSPVFNFGVKAPPAAPTSVVAMPAGLKADPKRKKPIRKM